jgi:hypothetical protein
MSYKYTFVTNDVGLLLRRRLKYPNGDPVDLSGATVMVRWKQKRVPYEQRTAVVVDAADGVVEYAVQAGDFKPDEVGLFFEWEVTFTPTQRLTTPDPDGPYLVRAEVG